MAKYQDQIIEETGANIPGSDAPGVGAPDPFGNHGVDPVAQPSATPEVPEGPAEEPVQGGDAGSNGGMLSIITPTPAPTDGTEDTGATYAVTQQPTPTPGVEDPGKEGGGPSIWMIAIIVLIAVLVAAIAVIIVKLLGGSKKRNKRAEKQRDVETVSAPMQMQRPSTRVPVHRKGGRPSIENAGAFDTTVRLDPGTTIPGAPMSAPEHGGFKIGFAQTIGSRENQEDSYCITDWKNPHTLAERGLLAAVADGIGGLSNGQNASGAAVRSICANFERQDPRRSMSDRLLELAAQAQQEVLQVNLRGDRCGTTLVSVLIKNEEMVILSVGDSRIALYRAGTLLQMNREHVLGRENDEKQALNMDGETLDKRKQGALTSYLGKENLRSIDRTLNPIRLVPGDRILLMSDGVFGTLKDREIIEKLSLEPDQAAQAIIRAVDEQKRPGQDNATIVIVGLD